MQQKTDKSRKIEERQVVVFALGEEEFGVDISEVREIIKIEQFTKIPDTEGFIKGVINLRGGIIVIIDLAMKLGLKGKETDKNTRILVVEIGENVTGMVVDSATEVLTLNRDLVQPAPAIITKKIGASYIEGVAVLGDRLLIVLDLAKLLGKEEIKTVIDVGQKAF